MSAADDVMITHKGVRYRAEDAKRLKLEATPEPVVGASQAQTKQTAPADAKSKPAKKTAAKKTAAKKSVTTKSAEPSNKADTAGDDKGTA